MIWWWLVFSIFIFVVGCLILTYLFWDKPKLTPQRMIGIDGDTYVIMEVTYDAMTGRKTVTLIDQGSFERENGN